MEMIAVDTNVVIRFLVDNHPLEGKRARQLFEDRRVLIPESVLLESEWVLRAVYGFSRDERMLVMQVLDGFDAGFDFADALHYARSAGLEMKTFDRKFINRGKKQNWQITSP
jgi:predicted nucleic-acid-binding protein